MDKDHFHVNVQMYSIWDGTTEDGKDKQCWEQFIKVPDEWPDKPTFVPKEVFDKFMSKKDWKTSRRRNFWRMMKYWNNKSKIKMIDQKQFLLDTKLMTVDNWTSDYPIYEIDKEMLNYARQHREEIRKYYPNLLYVIEQVEDAVLLYNVW